MGRANGIGYMLPLLLGMMAFGTWGAGADALWFDEFWSLFNAGGATYEGPPRDVPLGPVDIWRQVAEIDPIHPPGYALLLAAWGRLAGWSVFAGRYLSVLLGMLSVAMIVLAGREILSVRAGWVAGWLLGSAAFYAHYYHEMRMYTLLVLLVSAALWSYWRLAERDGGLVAGGAFVVSLAGLVYTQYLSLFVIVGIGVYHLLFARKTRHWWVVAGLAALAGLLYIPWTGHAWQLLIGVSGQGAREGVFTTERIIRWGGAAFTNSLALTTWRDALSLVWVAVLLAALSLWPVRGAWRGRVFLWLNWVVVGVCMLLINALTGMFIHIRYLLVMFPALMLIYAAGTERLPRWIVVGGVLLWAASGIWHYTAIETRYNRNEVWTLHWEDITTALDGRTMPDDLIIVQAAHDAEYWFYWQIAGYYLHENPADVTITPLRDWTTSQEYAAQLREQTANAERLFYVVDLSQRTNRGAAFPTHLSDAYADCGDLPYDGAVRVTLYALECIGEDSN